MTLQLPAGIGYVSSKPPTTLRTRRLPPLTVGSSADPTPPPRSIEESLLFAVTEFCAAVLSVRPFPVSGASTPVMATASRRTCPGEEPSAEQQMAPSGPVTTSAGTPALLDTSTGAPVHPSRVPST